MSQHWIALDSSRYHEASGASSAVPESGAEKAGWATEGPEARRRREGGEKKPEEVRTCGRPAERGSGPRGSIGLRVPLALTVGIGISVGVRVGVPELDAPTQEQYDAGRPQHPGRQLRRLWYVPGGQPGGERRGR